MSEEFYICRNCGKKFDKKDVIKVKRGYKVERHCPNCNSVFVTGFIKLTDDFDSEITTEIEPLTETKLEPKFKAGDRVFNKVTRKWVNIVEFDTETGLYIVRYDDGIRGRSLESEMIEGLVEEETKPNIIEEAKTYWDSIKDAWICPEGYIFKDENGNIINAQKIVLEKKKKEYPKTYKECCETMQVARSIIWFDYNDVRSISKEGDEYESHIENTLCAFRKLLICRDAYWKIAGEEMGLGKPWEPDWENPDHDSYPTITRCGGKIIKTTIYTHDCPFAFPTAEMRDAFYENFKELIESVKDLL